MDKFGIYVHIPFCKKKCKYCDFISFFCDEQKVEKYFERLKDEIKSSKYKGKVVSTIYIGGGTPSFVDSKYILEVLETIFDNFNVVENAEITIEVNPGTVSKEKLEAYRNFGINRLSIGLQSTHNRLLELIGRIHTYEEFLYTYNLAKEVGFTNVNIDLMLALPTQTIDELIASVNDVISLNPNHISLYSLILEEDTELARLVENNESCLVDEELERKMYWKTKNILEKNGYNHYEISNFSKKGFESNHNSDCWNQEEYIGFGLSAHSYVENIRFSNTVDFNKYIENQDCIINEVQTRETKAKEYMMLGLRKLDGVSISKFERKFGINPLFYFRFEIDKLVKKGLIEVDLDNIKLTTQGLDLANIVFEEFV